MKMVYKDFYRKYGINTIGEMNKRMFNTTSVILPKNSTYSRFLVSSTMDYVNKNEFNSEENHITVMPVYSYGDNAVGKFIKKKISDSVIYKDVVNNTDGLTIINPTSRKVLINREMLYVYDFGYLNNLYKYSDSKFNLLYMFHNSLNKVVSLHNDMNYFIRIELPDFLPTKFLLEKMATNIDITDMKRIYSYTILNVVELWKLLTPEHTKKSIYRKFNVERLGNTTLIIEHKGRCIFLNLSILLSFVKEFNNKSDSVGSDTVLNILYRTLNSLIKNENDDDLDISSIASDKSLVRKVNELVSNTNRNTINVVIDEDEDGEVSVLDKSHDLLETEYKDIDSNVTFKELKEPDKKEVIETLLAESYIDKKTSKKLNDILDGQKITKINNVKLTDILDTNIDDLTLSEENVVEGVVLLDKGKTFNTVKNADKKYIKEQYNKDLIRTIFKLQDNNMLITDYSMVLNESITGKMEEHEFFVTTTKGDKTKIKFFLPYVTEDGDFKLNNVTYRMRKQRADLPIRKIDKNNVALSSYYGKLFIKRSEFKKDDLGYAIFRQLSKRYLNDKSVSNLVSGEQSYPDINLPSAYTKLAMYTTSFYYKGFMFSFAYKERKDLSKDNKIEEIEKSGKVSVGEKLYLDFDNNLYLNDNGLKNLGNFYEFLDLDMSKLPIEFSHVKIYSKVFSVVSVIIFFIGLTNTLKLLKSKYLITELKSKDIPIFKKYYTIVFKDKKLHIERDFSLNDIVLGGLISDSKILKDFTISSLNRKSFSSLFIKKLDLGNVYNIEFKVMRNMFVDNITKSILEKMKEPTDLIGLLIRASELLTDDNYKNPNNVSDNIIRGYERIPGMLYKDMVKSVKDYENKSNYTKSKINLNPYCVMSKINTDSTTVLLDDLNPMAEIKQVEDITFLGEGGRSKEGMNRGSRVYNNSEIGIVSEASKDSGDVGVSAYLTASPAFTDIRGNVISKETDELEWKNLVSTSTMISPFGTNDDVKRLNFANIMKSHVIPINGSHIPYVLTGYESMISYKTNSKFVKMAKEDSVIVKISNNKLFLEYKDKTKETVSLNSWTSKEENGLCYTHNFTLNVKVGQKVKKNDTLAYNEKFFEPSFFDSTKVIYKEGRYVNVCVSDEPATYEDSCSINSRLKDDMSAETTVVSSHVLDINDNVFNLVAVDSEVKLNDVLFTITDSILSEKDIDERTLEILQDMKSMSPKSKYNGKISKITVRYNCEVDDLSDTLFDIVNKYDKDAIINTGFKGKVDEGYNIKGKPLLKGSLEIRIYIHVNAKLGIGDKGIFGNQLKFTIGEVFNEGIETTSGIEIDAFFSKTSIAARIVYSPYLIGTTSMLLHHLGKSASDMYFENGKGGEK